MMAEIDAMIDRDPAAAAASLAIEASRRVEEAK
jgi:hypothetical protein